MATTDTKSTTKSDTPAAAKKPPPVSHDRKGTWYMSNAVFPMEDPTYAPSRVVRFEAGQATQAESTRWTEGQWKAGVLKKFDGHPEDEGTKEIKYVAPPPPAPPSAK